MADLCQQSLKALFRMLFISVLYTESTHNVLNRTPKVYICYIDFILIEDEVNFFKHSIH